MAPTKTNAGNDHILSDVVCDPKTPAGQKVGAVLVVKRIVKFSQQSQVYDRVIVEEMHARYCVVKNLRCDIKEALDWKALFPLSKGENCGCERSTDKQKICMCEIQADVTVS